VSAIATEVVQSDDNSDIQLLAWSRSDFGTSSIIEVDRKYLVLRISHIASHTFIVISSSRQRAFPTFSTSTINRAREYSTLR